MSRIPSGQSHYSHPAQPSSQVYYTHAGQPPVQHAYAQDMNMYPYDRNPSAPAPGGIRPVNWAGDGVVYGNAPGPSSRGDPYAAYPQPHHRTSSSSNGSASQMQGQMWPGNHPAQAPLPRQDTATASRSVKLEDLVAQERTSRPVSSRSTSNAAGLTAIPLTATQSTDNMRANGSASNNASQADNGGGNNNSGPSEFIKKLYRMLEDESALYGKGKPAGAPRGEGAPRGSVGWGKGGASFVVWDMNDFTTKVL